ncbi:SPOR domain-containing protein [Parendozoicomonas sp. Alg238-R29]|uniref:SPOR domain-containing protein n=1 Tax=Parendozoicomonas sp. Alg238-R29 TaxID=2993446 RepID=UPI00248DCEB3|nr:SPOR domain-containing protein [Parendozoicomonas sp. Alg238-R29]
MDHKRKQRLTGALVLVASIVILYPLLFSGGFEDEDMVLTIPEPPEAPEIPKYVERLDILMEAPPEPADFAPAPPAAPEERPSLDKKQLPVSWSLQLAAFSKQLNAVQLQDRLRGDGFRSYTRESKGSKGRILYRVYVGPDLRKEKILKLRNSIEKDYSLKGMVVRFVP